MQKTKVHIVMTDKNSVYTTDITIHVKEIYNGTSLTYDVALIYVVSELKIKYSDTV